jgi:Protein of unknown function (DUF3562)
MIKRHEAADDANLQLNAIEEIALESGRPVSEVKCIYEAELARLKADARIRDYLLLFASRRTREALVHGSAHQRASVEASPS